MISKTELPFLERQWRRLPCVDADSGDLSITRILALFFAALCWHAVENAHAISLNVLWLALACMACAFGKSTFTFLLRRMSHRGEATQVDVNVRETREIIDRRDRDQGFEAT